MSREADPWYRWEQQDLLLFLRIQPRSSKDAFVAPHGDRYRVQIKAPPVEGQANERLTRFLAKSFGVGRRDVSLVNGEHSRNKGVRIRAPRKLPLPVERD